jgi:molecular chaperone DnaK
MDQPSSTESNAITLRIRFKSASLDEFIGRYGADVSPGGIFIRTKQPVEVGTSLQFEFSLADGAPLLFGMGTVAWVRESDPARANNVPGMGLRFDKLTPESQHTHQLILAEKARKEGKASSTPYPPTAFVAPAARTSAPPEASKPVPESPKVEPGPANFAITRPSPAAAVRPATPSPPTAPLARPFAGFGDSDEFSEGGKTEISDKPLDYMKELEREAKEAEAARHSPVKTSENAVPQSLLDDAPTGASDMPITKSGPPPEGFDAPEPAEPAPFAKVDTDAGQRGGLAAILDLDGGKEPVAAPADEVLPELSAGVPIEETSPERTEEVSAAATSAPIAESETVSRPDTLDLGTGLEGNFSDDRPPSRDEVPSVKRKGSGKTIALVAVAAAAAAFVAVYLVKTKPWQDQSKPEVPPAAATPPVAENTPPVPPAAEPAKTAAEPLKPAAEAVKPAAELPKPAAEPEKPAAEPAKPVAEPAKPAAEEPKHPVVAAEPAEKAEKKESAKSEKPDKPERESSKSGKSKAARWDDRLSVAAPDEEIYRLVVRSAPLSAEVLIDGEYFSRTPCERRILDPKKSYSIVVRKEGYEPHERVIGPSDNWVKKGEERVLTVTTSLKRIKAGATVSPPEEFPAAGAKSEKKAESPVAKPESLPSSESLKAAAKEPAKAESPAAKPEPAKPAPEKPVFKPAPDFEDGKPKAKE